MKNKNIDDGRSFDWGRTSSDYAKYRDIYPKEMYDKILSWNLCTYDCKVLDLGTGTGVFPRNMYKYGADFTGVDISENQIAQAKRLSDEHNMNIKYYVSEVEKIDFLENTFDVITAFTCFFYFDHKKLLPVIKKVLKPGGHLLIGYLAWLPFEDRIAGESEKLILKYNPNWTGAGERRRPVDVPDIYNKYFDIVHNEYFDVQIPFSIKSWNGRIKACRGVGASLSGEEIIDFEKEHLQMLNRMTENKFTILHNVALVDLKLKES
ncbi:MAG: methyltransferase domain-containing protein [Ruminococcus sp.]|nr:methyltransferase domain-containing protein [Ruminococcus sp.]